MILKDRFLSQSASDIRIKLQQLEKQDLAASLDEMVQTAINTFYNRTGEGGQGPGKGEKERDKACPDAGRPPGNPHSKLRVLEGQGKCLICRQTGYWAKECPNRDKSKTAGYICHQLGHWATLHWGPKSLKVKRQAFSHSGSTGLKWPTPASPPVTDNHHGAGAKGATGCGR